jgi:hypothetical protein
MSRSRRRPANSQKRAAADRAAALKFWGVALPQDPTPVHMASDPSAMMISLGEPPLRNNEIVAQQAFVLLAHRVAQLAFVAATAAGLDEDPID